MPYSYSMEIDGTKIEAPIVDKIVYYSAPKIAVVMGKINFNDRDIINSNKIIEWAGKTGEFNGKKYSDITLKVELAGETLRTHTIEKAVPMGCAEIYTDQDGFGHFELALQASKNNSLYKYYWAAAKDDVIHIIYQIEPLSVIAIDNIANYSGNDNDDDSFLEFQQSNMLVSFDAVRFNKPTIHGILDINLDVNQSSNLLGNTHREIYSKIGELIAGSLMVDESIIWTSNPKGVKKQKQDLVHRKIIRDKDIRVNIEEEKNFYGQLSNLKISICEAFKGIYGDALVETSQNGTDGAPRVNGGGSLNVSLKGKLDAINGEVVGKIDFEGRVQQSDIEKYVSDMKNAYDNSSLAERGDILVPESAEYLKNPPVALDANGVPYSDPNYKWPPNNGFKGKPIETTPSVGDEFDRVGNENGRFVSPIRAGSIIPKENRALPYHFTQENIENEPSYSRYKVTRNFNELEEAINEYNNPKLSVEENEVMREEFMAQYKRNTRASDTYTHEPGKTYSGEIADAFKDGDGGGTQWELPMSVDSLKQLGMIDYK